MMAVALSRKIFPEEEISTQTEEERILTEGRCSVSTVTSLVLFL